MHDRFIMISITVSQAREVIPNLVDRVLEGEEVMLSRSGRPDLPESRRAADTLDPSVIIDYALSRGEKSDLADLRGLSVERAEALVAEVRASRSRSCDGAPCRSNLSNRWPAVD